MASVCFYFQVHQPFRVKRYRFFDIGNDHFYFNDSSDTDVNNEKVLKKVAQKCYLPANRIMYENLKKYPEFKIAFSLSGVFLEQCERYAPEVIKSFQELVKTGRVEILGETYYHSLAFLYSRDEFREQVFLHRAKIQELFGITPRVFRNTELIYHNDLAHEISQYDYDGIILEGADRLLGSWRSPNFVHYAKNTPQMKLLLKNYKLSDDIAFRFGEKSWKEYPLTASKFASWVNAINGNGETVNLFMDYETFGEHQWEDTGIFDFLRALPQFILQNRDNDFLTPSDVLNRYNAHGEIDAPDYVSWADQERDLSAWRSNDMQYDALEKIYALEKDVMKTENVRLIHEWRKLQTSDHYYYMCTKWFADGDVHTYFSPYESPYEAYIAFINVLADFRLRVDNCLSKNDV